MTLSSALLNVTARLVSSSPRAMPSLGDDDGYSSLSCLSELKDPGVAATALGVCSIALSAFIGLPQAYKIYQRKSARGVSFLTLGLGNIGSFLYVLNLTILHYNQITLSTSRDFAFWVRAQRSLTFVWVELLNALSMLVIYPVASFYATDEPCEFKFVPLGVNFVCGMRQAAFYWFACQSVIIFLAWCPAVFVFAVDGRCEPLADYGNVLGLVVAVIVVSKFLPQLYASLRAEGSHSLSYVTYGVDAVAGIVAWAQKVFVTRERLSSWLPPLFLHALEVTVLCVNFYNDTKAGRGFSEMAWFSASDGAGYEAVRGSDETRSERHARDRDAYPFERGSEDEYDARLDRGENALRDERARRSRSGRLLGVYGTGGSGEDDSVPIEGLRGDEERSRRRKGDDQTSFL